jgi:hypothetical protein
LQQVLLCQWQPVNARGQHRLHRGRHLQAVEGFAETIGARLSDQHASRRQRAHALLQKEGIPLSASDEQAGEGHEAGVLTKEGLQ